MLLCSVLFFMQEKPSEEAYEHEVHDPPQKRRDADSDSFPAADQLSPIVSDDIPHKETTPPSLP